MSTLALLTLTVTLSGMNVDKFEAPSSHFVSTNPLCTQVTVLPLPATGPKSAVMKGTKRAVGTNQMVLSVPLKYEGHSFCRYRLDSVQFGVFRGLEAVNLATSKEAVVAANELNLLKSKPGTFEVQCAHSTCRVLKNGSQVGYGSGNIAYLFLDPKLFGEGETKASLNLSFK